MSRDSGTSSESTGTSWYQPVHADTEHLATTDSRHRRVSRHPFPPHQAVRWRGLVIAKNASSSSPYTSSEGLWGKLSNTWRLLACGTISFRFFHHLYSGARRFVWEGEREFESRRRRRRRTQEFVWEDWEALERSGRWVCVSELDGRRLSHSPRRYLPHH